MAGRYHVAENTTLTAPYDDEPDMSPYEVYVPQFFADPPPMITLPAALPEPIAADLRSSFSLFWHDLDSCANRVRSATERLLSHLKVPSTVVSKGRRRVRLSLHERIARFHSVNPALSDAMMAVKWIGNAGSHRAPLSTLDLMDGYDLVEHILDELFEARGARIARLSKLINRRKRPRSS